METPIVFFVQPIYGYIPPRADSHQKDWLGYNLARGIIHGVKCNPMCYIDRARNQLVAHLVDVATHLLWVDQDMMLSLNIVRRLLGADKDVVSAVYFGKDDAHLPVAFDDADKGTPLLEPPTDLQQVGGVGMGCCLTKTSVFRRMEEHFGDRTWFKCQEGPGFSGEDLWFARRCKAMGVPIWLDGREDCVHVGDELITREHWRRANGAREMP